MKFNKKNLINFANSLYKRTPKNEYYIPLCEGRLSKPNGEVLNCALGELHCHFVGPICVPSTEAERLNWLSERGIVEGEDGKWVRTISDEHVVVDNVLSNVSLKKRTAEERKEHTKHYWDQYLYEALHVALVEDVPMTNDAVKGMSELAMVRRAKKVQEKLLQIANDYLG